MSKDYRYQREEWDSVEDDDHFGKKKSVRRNPTKERQKRDELRREKQKRLHQESY
ncbi:hypothetical protein HHX48_00535 [Salinimonas sp. HHU 13199]|uniref:Small highly charged protein n=1 Tax=Salinimonas profundi TaxID=2729140 RepID=A0ABR8LD33_9ALTE|nr:hypothetical protein [Salinimonas profundi]MBD3584219.1 hypothetical protein [Salinimonas profundi]